MSQADTQRVHELFLQAVDMDPEQAQAFLDEVCADDQPLRDKVNRLLEASQASADFLNDMMADAHAYGLNEIEDHCFRDRQFGPYQVISILKQGGMGSVFLARRADGEFNRRVIIKMIQMGMNFNQNQTLFAHEKKVLASLNHPNIVQLYDSGETDERLSWFAMEWVNGTHITDHCNDRRLNLKGRLELFMSILNAVQFAHQHLVIHGDIKPANILVNEDGQVKLLDFGIARLLRNDGPGMTAHSNSYLTPEQARQEPAITTTDIHQLGQLLFELLTGLQPVSVRDDAFNFPTLSDTLQIHRQRGTLGSFSWLCNSSRTELKRHHHSDLQHYVSPSILMPVLCTVLLNMGMKSSKKVSGLSGKGGKPNPGLFASPKIPISHFLKGVIKISECLDEL